MEYENKHEGASKAVGGTALGLSIGATVASLFPGLLENLGVGRNGSRDVGAAIGMMAALNNTRATCSEDHFVNRHELGLQNEIAAKDSKIAHLESTIYTDGKIADVYERLNTKIGILEAQMADQRVYNATLNGTLSCIQGQIAQLASLTKIVIPNTSICPGWGNVTVAPATTTTA